MSAFFFTNLSLMTNTATLNTSNKNTNNCGKLKYILRTKQKTITVYEFSGERERENNQIIFNE